MFYYNLFITIFLFDNLLWEDNRATRAASLCFNNRHTMRKNFKFKPAVLRFKLTLFYILLVTEVLIKSEQSGFFSLG